MGMQIEQRVENLESRLSDLRAQLKSFKAEEVEAESDISIADRSISWELSKQRYRDAIDRQQMRAVVIVGGVVTSLVIPIAFFTAILDRFYSGVGASALTLLGFGGVYSVLFCGTDDETEHLIRRFQGEREKATQTHAELQDPIRRTQDEIQATLDQLETLKPELAAERMRQVEEQRKNDFKRLATLLFEEQWRELRSIEFEQYVARVFQHLGYETEETPMTGDQGVDFTTANAVVS